MEDRPLFIDDMVTKENLKLRSRLDFVFGVLAATTFFYFLLVASSPSDFLGPRSLWIQLLSLIAVWGSLYTAWLFSHLPLKIFPDRIEHMKQVIPLSRISGITSWIEDDKLFYKISYKDLRYRLIMPWWYKCEEGSPKSAALEALKREVESSGVSIPVPL